MNQYTVKQVKLKIIEDFFIYQHYMKRKPINKFCFWFYFLVYKATKSLIKENRYYNKIK